MRRYKNLMYLAYGLDNVNTSSLFFYKNANWSAVVPIASDECVALPVEQAILWSMRVWVIGLHHDVAAPSRIRQMMKRLGAGGAAPCLEGFMFALGHGATRRIAIHCTCHDQVEADERILLDVLCLAQQSQQFKALLLLRGMATNDAAWAALRGAQALGTELALAGHVLQAPDAIAAPFKVGGDPAVFLGRCTTTLH